MWLKSLIIKLFTFCIMRAAVHIHTHVRPNSDNSLLRTVVGIDREFEFYDFFSFLKFNELY